MEKPPLQFGLGDLFLLTTTAAIIFAVLYYIPLTLTAVASYALHEIRWLRS